MHEITAAVMREPEQFSHETVTLEDPNATEVLVDVRATGVCHTDYHAYTNQDINRPVVLGHEGAGVVEAVGEQVTGVEPGDHVVLWVIPSCGQCEYCSSGRPYLCSQYTETRGTMPDGTKRLADEEGSIDHFFSQSSFATKAVVPERSAIPIREDVPFEIAALLGCGIPTGAGAVLNTATVRAGEDVAVFGCGGVGASAILAADLVGARNVIAVDIDADKLDRMREIGATHVVDASETDPVSEIDRLVGGVDYSFECIGRSRTIEQAFNALDRGGTAVATTTKDTGSLEIDGSAFLMGTSIVGNIVGSIRPRADLPKLADLYAEDKLDLDALLTDTYQLSELDAAFEALHEGDGIRNVVEIDG
ncbi:alcohol dehydrogenase catalytic domain-containing protein [Halopenitus sp. POP-27]|uniref:alcohol dehydrogenase catalytic domain-containing protein n=1 Tax=Halopenitus sp. POP-27 TaxID=2994425 RepID=UPI00246946FA|nr:alcohol dehydrogenase catalytic domain-containing protein [Halopenitus sp. POP-27]